jgi:hypothetical protein
MTANTFSRISRFLQMEKFVSISWIWEINQTEKTEGIKVKLVGIYFWILSLNKIWPFGKRNWFSFCGKLCVDNTIF